MGLPPLLQLQKTLLDPDDDEAFEYPLHIQDQYNEFRHLRTTEHAEMQLVSYYLQNPPKSPMVRYIGVSKFRCYMCTFSSSSQETVTKRTAFFVLRTHGKVWPLVAASPGKRP